jgi:hypothetical protein
MVSFGRKHKPGNDLSRLKLQVRMSTMSADRCASWRRRCRKKVARGGARAQRVRNPWISYAAEKELRRSDRIWTTSSPCSIKPGTSVTLSGFPPAQPYSSGSALAALALHHWLPSFSTFGAILDHLTPTLQVRPRKLRRSLLMASPLQALIGCDVGRVNYHGSQARSLT